MSWACPPPFLCVGLMVSSRRIIAPLAPCLSWRFPSLVRVSLLRRGVSPCVGPVGALGELRWLHLYRLTPDLVGLLLFAGCRWCSGRCFMFCCAPIRPYSWRSFGQFHWLLRVPCASPPYGVVPWTIAWRVTGWASCPPPRYSGTLSFALTFGHDSRVLMTTAIDIMWGVVPVSLDAVVLTPCYCGVLGGLHGALRLGWLHVPSLHFQDSVSCRTCSHDSQILRLPAIDIVWRWPCLPRFRLLQTPYYCGMLGGL